MCDLGNLYGGESDYVDVTIRPIGVGSATLTTTVSASNDLNPDNNQIVLKFEVLPATDLYPRYTVHSRNLRPGETTLVTAPTSLLQGETGEIVVNFINGGPDTAPDGRLELHFRPQVSTKSVTASRGKCDLISCDCSNVLAGERIEVRIKFQTDTTGFFSLTAETRYDNGFDSDSGNNGTDAQFESKANPGSSSGQGAGNGSSGGGAFTFFLPMVALCLLARRVRRQRTRRAGDRAGDSMANPGHFINYRRRLLASTPR